VDLHQKIVIADTVFAQEVDGEMVLLDMHSEHYFGLDSVGTSIWQALQEKERLDDVLDVMLQQYEVEPAILQKDLLTFVDKLEKSGLISLHSYK